MTAVGVYEPFCIIDFLSKCLVLRQICDFCEICLNYLFDNFPHETRFVGSEFIQLVLISLITNNVVVQRSSNNYSTPILTDLVRIDDIINNSGKV